MLSDSWFMNKLSCAAAEKKSAIKVNKVFHLNILGAQETQWKPEQLGAHAKPNWRGNNWVKRNEVFSSLSWQSVAAGGRIAVALSFDRFSFLYWEITTWIYVWHVVGGCRLVGRRENTSKATVTTASAITIAHTLLCDPTRHFIIIFSVLQRIVYRVMSCRQQHIRTGSHALYSSSCFRWVSFSISFRHFSACVTTTQSEWGVHFRLFFPFFFHFYDTRGSLDCVYA